MKSPRNIRFTSRRGITLIELTIVISLLLVLVTGAILSINFYQNWQKGLEAGEEIKKVYSAQRQYLAENPTVLVTALTPALINDYLPNGPVSGITADATTFPTEIEGLDGETLTINVTVSPPVFESGGATYDPSDSPDDNLWDAGTK